jgi:hypothetical protein
MRDNNERIYIRVKKRDQLRRLSSSSSFLEGYGTSIRLNYFIKSLNFSFDSILISPSPDILSV